ncbi:MAG TPA: hypothetical protein ENJ44_08630, partial [Oceanospirillales bacterium]|nr:hypothetical protein [Oceanospirillales bacterium]
MLISPLAFSQEELPPVTVYPDNWGSTLTSLDLTTTYQQDGAGGGGGGGSYYPHMESHTSHSFDCNSGGGSVSGRIGAANIAFGAARSLATNQGNLGGFLRDNQAGSLFEFN